MYKVVGGQQGKLNAELVRLIIDSLVDTNNAVWDSTEKNRAVFNIDYISQPKEKTFEQIQSTPKCWRVVDWIFIVFFIINLIFIVPFFDIEQIRIKDTNFKQPYRQTTIWIDIFFFLPFCAFAAYSFYKKNNRIRDISIIWV
ncbi:MAG: hypothetical protein EZS28_009792 [Streblomastix strix]|uniref:Uncharacterized protein n=1 Tax=Streblomastix strix TaxID=222440 RepID=A0A5J4WII4_9EUKA|nr:MAG: hypothetical protein EZS28_009792 [Streblomastix strix]